MKLNTLVALMLATTFAAAQSAAAPPPCSAPESRQFDFWVGDWEVSWPAGGGMPAGKGTNRIIHVLDGCALEENFDGGSAIPLRGRSFSVYLPREGKWKQTWVDNQGSYLDFSGEFRDGQMVLVREAVGPKGAKFLQRMVWKNITADSLDWSWERSLDGGKTWQVMWPIHYARRGATRK